MVVGGLLILNGFSSKHLLEELASSFVVVFKLTENASNAIMKLEWDDRLFSLLYLLQSFDEYF